MGKEGEEREGEEGKGRCLIADRLESEQTDLDNGPPDSIWFHIYIFSLCIHMYNCIYCCMYGWPIYYCLAPKGYI